MDLFCRLGKFLGNVDTLRKTRVHAPFAALECVAAGGECVYYFTEQLIWQVVGVMRVHVASGCESVCVAVAAVRMWVHVCVSACGQPLILSPVSWRWAWLSTAGCCCSHWLCCRPAATRPPTKTPRA
jgi:hypothetical protein